MSDFEKIREMYQANIDEETNKVIDALYSTIEEMKKQGIDLSDKEQVERYLALKQFNQAIDRRTEIKLKILSRQEKRRDFQSHKRIRKELIELFASCNRFPRRIRLRLNKKKLSIMCTTIAMIETRYNDHTLFSDWKMPLEIIKYLDLDLRSEK